WRWITWGSVAATILWLGASALFSWYAANFGKFNETYGSLGGAIGFMTWLWISAIVILFGAELDAEMEHQTARDTTTGSPKPIGARGAKMADTVGAARSEGRLAPLAAPRGLYSPKRVLIPTGSLRTTPGLSIDRVEILVV